MDFRPPAAALLLAVLLVVAAPAAHSAPTCDDELSSAQLVKAVDAALTELYSTQGWLLGIKESNGYTHSVDIYGCTPDATKWTYPDADEATGLLKRVLDTGKLTVAGVQWSTPGAADYKTDPENPTGFWPDYLEAVAAKLGSHYGKTITVERKYYTTSVLVVSAVQEAEEVDMSEPYYYISGFAGNDPRTQAMAVSCPTAGTASDFYTKMDSGITNVDQLVNTLETGQVQALGFIGQGNYDAVSSILPKSASPLFLTNQSDISAHVDSGAIIAGYLSEGDSDDLGANYKVFPSGIISPRGFLFRKDYPTCDDVAAMSDTMLPPAATLTIFIVLSVIVLVLAVLLTFIIVKERNGSPIFTPLVEKV
eukprot:jgi/Tetstr1/449009/TSEL_036234.t1